MLQGEFWQIKEHKDDIRTFYPFTLHSYPLIVFAVSIFTWVYMELERAYIN